MYQNLLAKLALALDAERIPYMVIGGQAVESFVHDTNVLPLTDLPTLLRVDLIFSFTSYETGAISRAVIIEFDRVPVRFAAVEDLVIHKLVAGRPCNIEDIAGVLRRKPTLDLEYLRKWLASFRDVLNRDLVSEFTSIQQSLLDTRL